MFTGIIEEIGKVSAIRSGSKDAHIEISASKVLEGTQIGDSIAVNGVCLTVTQMGKGTFSAYAMAETMRRSDLKYLSAGSAVNLERACLPTTRMGGHIVSGHVDCCGRITDISKEALGTWIKFAPDGDYMRYTAEKGSVAIDGVSLTIAAVTDNDFSVCLIPHTGEETILLSKKINDEVNLEFDMIAKYTERLLYFAGKDSKSDKPKSGITEAFLAENGFLIS